MSFLACVALVPLIVLHIYLRCKGMTTYEFIKADYKQALPTKSSMYTTSYMEESLPTSVLGLEEHGSNSDATAAEDALPMPPEVKKARSKSKRAEKVQLFTSGALSRISEEDCCAE